MSSAIEIPATQRKLVEAAMRLILRHGFAATGVDRICAEAGVTKGAFFHYFKSKEEIGLAAMTAWTDHGMSLYAAARQDPQEDPLAALHRFFDIMIGFVNQSGEELSCVLGMMTQETAATAPHLRESADLHLTTWVVFASGLLSDAKRAHPPAVDFDPEEIAWMLNSLWQGSMLINKARRTPAMVIRNLEHARAYVDSLFNLNPPTKTQNP